MLGRACSGLPGPVRARAAARAAAQLWDTAAGLLADTRVRKSAHQLHCQLAALSRSSLQVLHALCLCTSPAALVELLRITHMLPEALTPL